MSSMASSTCSASSVVAVAGSSSLFSCPISRWHSQAMLSSLEQESAERAKLRRRRPSTHDSALMRCWSLEFRLTQTERGENAEAFTSHKVIA
eukprot:1556318-Rhodomonas_salina.2